MSGCQRIYCAGVMRCEKVCFSQDFLYAYRLFLRRACPVLLLDIRRCACGFVEEKALNLAIALHVQEELQHAGYPVVMVRDTDTAVGDTTLSTVAERKRSDIQYRAQLVNETENCILVSIHQNFFEQSQYSGAQMFYSPNNTRSAALAEAIRQSVVEQLQPENTRENKQAESGIYLLNHVDVPAVIVECGFISNPEEAALLCDSAYQQKLAAAIADGVLSFCAAE